MREETIMASVVKHTADLMQENHKLKSDLTQAHEMIRELREVLIDLVPVEEGATEGKRARAVLQKWQGKL